MMSQFKNKYILSCVYLIKHIWVSRIEKRRDPFLNPSNDFRPDRVYQEVISWDNICFITGYTERCNIS